jgi:hypothetical protein
MKNLGLKLEYKGSNDHKVSFSHEIPYVFMIDGDEYSMKISGLDELSIRRRKEKLWDMVYCVFTDKTHTILRKFLNENSDYMESKEELIPEFECNGISLDTRIINNDEIKQEIVDYCELMIK